MTHDDDQVGRLLSRREAMELLGSAGAVLLLGGAGAAHVQESITPNTRQTPACIVRPEQIEGPYFVDGRLQRSDIRPNTEGGGPKPGLPLALNLTVSQLDGQTCRPLEGAHVDIWQCDAGGVYSGVRDRSFDTVGQDFLRGYQITDAEGGVRFTTIYPGWYRGRAVHIHFKIRTDPTDQTGYEFTSQLYFDDALTDRLYGQPPYSEYGQDRTRNEQDGIYRRGGDQLLLNPEDTGEGLAATFAIGLDLS